MQYEKWINKKKRSFQKIAKNCFLEIKYKIECEERRLKKYIWIDQPGIEFGTLRPQRQFGEVLHIFSLGVYYSAKKVPWNDR